MQLLRDDSVDHENRVKRGRILLTVPSVKRFFSASVETRWGTLLLLLCRVAQRGEKKRSGAREGLAAVNLSADRHDNLPVGAINHLISQRERARGWKLFERGEWKRKVAGTRGDGPFCLGSSADTSVSAYINSRCLGNTHGDMVCRDPWHHPSAWRA